MHRTSDLRLILRFKLATKQKKMDRTPTMVGAYVAADSNSGMSNGYDPTADADMQCLQFPRPAELQVQTYPNLSGMFASGTQQFATIPIDMYPSNGNLHQRRQQPMSLEHAQAYSPDGYSAGSMPLGPSDDTNGDSLIVTIYWQRADYTWGQAQAVVTDQIRDAYVLSFMERLLIEDVCAERHRCGQRICNS
jgi:hypothetical protein